MYVFRIRAQTRKGWGEAAEALVVTTEKRGNERYYHASSMEQEKFKLSVSVDIKQEMNDQRPYFDFHGPFFNLDINK